MSLIPIGSVFPQDHSVVAVLSIPALDVSHVGRTEAELIDATSSETAGNFRELIPGTITVFGHNGEVIMEGSPDIISLAIDGGGLYWRIEQNAMLGCQTEAEALEEEAGLSCQDYDWDYDD